MSSWLHIRNLWKRYGEQVILENINLQIEQSEFVTMVGAEGCGKSTFLRILLGQETHSKGQILLNGQPFPAEPDASRTIVYSHHSVFPHLTVLQNVMFGFEAAGNPFIGRLLGDPYRIARERSRAMLNAVGLSHVENRFPYQLSPGMQQKLALAQALVMEPDILLLDEPFRMLEGDVREELHNLVLALWAETRVTVFMVAHDLNEGFYLGTRLLVFDKPRIDPQAPHHFGATVTYDLPIAKSDTHPLQPQVQQEILSTVEKTNALMRAFEENTP